ncbi:phage terminase small subunit P27 family [Roseovarius sp. A46]|uniref:phage terminase small subunit P27 family n=1 Tax=Roseovarius sp. A46 TaxID=2109331 RepID=UPI00101314DD|nr:phage terminase small subunit P27 family [Roseovarius sp. A46]RXV64860.1 phage terminase small subunit P27 family [Roseovarius sp. A46]
MKGRKPQLKPDDNTVEEVSSAPDWMTAQAKAEWHRIMPLLVERRILTEADMGSVENYCMAISTAREADSVLQERGHVYEDLHGNLRRNPASLVLKDAMQTARQLAAELGLTPVSRSRPSIREDDDPEDDLLQTSWL